LPKWKLSNSNANVDFATAWENPYVRKYLPERNRHRVQSIWDERERFIQALEKLPKVFTHGDAQPRNLFIRKNVEGEPELTAIDWALCGSYPIGAEIVQMIVFAIQFREIKVEAMTDLSEAVLFAYILGLRDVGWKGDPDWVRLGYQAYLLMSWGIGLPGNLAWGLSDELLPHIERFYGEISIDEMLTSAAYQFDHILDYADQARKTMTRFEE
jgi:hypothetical protein